MKSTIGAVIKIFVSAATLGTLDFVVETQLLQLFAPLFPDTIHTAVNNAVQMSAPDG